LLSARDHTFDSVRQFLWASLPYIYITIIYLFVIRNVTIKKGILLEDLKLYVWL
jgi:hypothetical protein